MSARPIEVKQRRRVAKMLSRKPPKAYLDLIQWLIDRRYAASRAQAAKIILDRRVRVDSHVLGVKRVPMLQKDGVTIKDQDSVEPYVPSEYRTRIIVSAPASS